MRLRQQMLRWLPTAGAVALALAIFSFDTPGSSPFRSDQAPDAPGTEALRAAFDPETGDLVLGVGAQQPSGDPDKTIDAELAKMLSRSDEGLEAVSYPDGRVGVHLKGRFMNASVARINADGSLETLCTEHTAEAHNFMHTDTEVDAKGREVR